MIEQKTRIASNLFNVTVSLNEDLVPVKYDMETGVFEDFTVDELAQIEAEFNATAYIKLRKAEYDKLNQYEMMFDDQLNGTTTWVDAINAIKAQYPKPE